MAKTSLKDDLQEWQSEKDVLQYKDRSENLLVGPIN